MTFFRISMVFGRKLVSIFHIIFGFFFQVQNCWQLIWEESCILWKILPCVFQLSWPFIKLHFPVGHCFSSQKLEISHEIWRSTLESSIVTFKSRPQWAIAVTVKLIWEECCILWRFLHCVSQYSWLFKKLQFPEALQL